VKKIHQYFPKVSKPQWVAICLGLLCTLLLLLTEFFHVPFASAGLQNLDHQIYDEIINLNLHPHNPSPRVVIIDIDEASIQKEGRWPWRRDRMADLLVKLKEDGVVTIGLDIVMSEEEINYALGLEAKLKQINKVPTSADTVLFKTLNKIAPQVDSDQTLAQTLLAHNVVLGFLFHNDLDIKRGKLPKPLADNEGRPLDSKTFSAMQFKSYNGSIGLLVDAAEQAGFVTNLPDNDGAIRKALLIANFQDKLYPSMALATAMNYLLVNNVELVKNKGKLIGIRLDGTFIPTNDRGQILAPYWGGPGTLNYYSATDVLQGKVAAKDLQGTIAIIGSTITLLADLHETPVSLVFPGVELVGNIVQAIVSQQVCVEYDWHTLEGSLIILCIGFLFAVIFPFLNVNLAILFTLLAILAGLGASVFFFVEHRLYIPSALLIVLITLQAIVNYAYSFVQERRQRKHISHLFGQYVPEDYLKELIAFPDHFSMDGQTRNMTVLFADIRNFTNLSENLDATGVKRLLNTFFTPITEIIFKNRGTIDKYVGDMIVAFWGAPIEDEEHAKHAIITALAIFKNMDAINLLMTTNNLPAVQIGVGLGSGLMNVGDMGSEFRRAYTVLGDTVNLASRLQDLTKFYKVNILVNDVARAGQNDFLWQAVDKVTVKGRKTALTIYQPLGLIAESSSEQINEIEHYHSALETYYAMNWELAAELFNSLNQSHPETYLYQLYLERISTFKLNPPPADWDGVYVHLKK